MVELAPTEPVDLGWPLDADAADALLRKGEALPPVEIGPEQDATSP